MRRVDQVKCPVRLRSSFTRDTFTSAVTEKGDEKRASLHSKRIHTADEKQYFWTLHRACSAGSMGAGALICIQVTQIMMVDASCIVVLGSRTERRGTIPMWGYHVTSSTSISPRYQHSCSHAAQVLMSRDKLGPNGCRRTTEYMYYLSYLVKQSSVPKQLTSSCC